MLVDSKSLLTTAIDLMVNHTERTQLMANIYDALDSATEDDVGADEEVKLLFKTAKDLAHLLMNKGVSSSPQAKMYFKEMKIDDGLKSVIDVGNYFPEEVLNDFNALFSKAVFQPGIGRSFKDLDEANTAYRLAGVADIAETSKRLGDAAYKYYEEVQKMVETVDEENEVLMSMNEDVKSIGEERIREKYKETTNRVKTGMWIDNLSGGGFKCGKLYVVASVSGGFKSGFLQNVAEYMTLNNKREDLKIPSGMKPYVLYVNLEMAQVQMFNRKAAFYQMDLNDLTNKAEANKKSEYDIMKEYIKENFDPQIDVLYKEATARDYTAQQLIADLKKREKDRLKCIAILFDYSDLLKYNLTKSEDLERITPLVRKNEELRNIAREFNIPVLTGIQLNRQAMDVKSHLSRAHYIDILKDISGNTIAKSFDIINVPEQLYICYKYNAANTDLFSIVVDKDRDHEACFVEPDGKKRPDKLVGGRVYHVAKMEGFKISNDYRYSVSDFGLVDEDVLETFALKGSEVEEITS